MKQLGIAILASLVLNPIALGRGVKGVYLIVTPSGTSGPLSCRIRAAQEPPKVENDLIRFRVEVTGGMGPFEWRLPLYKTNNGFNDVKVARIGTVSLNAERVFPLDLNIMDLDRADRDELTLTVRSKERYEGSCKLPVKALRQIAKAAPEKTFIMEGGISR